MANYSTWSKGIPSGASLQREFDDLYRSDKSILEATLNTEHYYNSSSKTSAGVHKHGSARIYMGLRSALSSPSDGDGRLMYCSDTSSLHVIGASSSTTIAASSLHDSRYVKIAGSTMTGALHISGVGNTGTTAPIVFLSNTSSARTYGLNTADDGTFQIFDETAGNLTRFSIGTTGILYSGTTFTIWHAGNDGASSGLDADTVDTFHIYSGTSTIAETGIAAGGDAQINITVSSGTTGAPTFLGYYDTSAVISYHAQCHGTTVIAVFHNPTGSTVSLPAQTITARVIR